MLGRIKLINFKAGWAFIVKDGDLVPPDWFFYRDDVAEGANLAQFRAGDRVSFDSSPRPDGRQRARNVRLAGFVGDVQDELRECRDCGLAFVLTTQERASFNKKGLLPPERCASCRSAKRAAEDYLGTRPNKRPPGT